MIIGQGVPEIRGGTHTQTQSRIYYIEATLRSSNYVTDSVSYRIEATEGIFGQRIMITYPNR